MAQLKSFCCSFLRGCLTCKNINFLQRGDLHIARNITGAVAAVFRPDYMQLALVSGLGGRFARGRVLELVAIPFSLAALSALQIEQITKCSGNFCTRVSETVT